MASIALNREERIGLATAVAAHVALLLVLVLRPPAGDVVIPPERIEVTLSDDVGLISTSPDPSRDAAPDLAPRIGVPAPSEPVAIEPQQAEPEPQQQPQPQPRAQAQPRSRPQPAPRARPQAPASEPERARPAPRETSRPAPRETARPAPQRPAPPREAERSGGSRLGSDFLEGLSDSAGSSRSAPAAQIGPRVQASLVSAISRQLKPHWSAPQGADAEQLVTVVRFRLNRDGSLSGAPTVVGQSGITPANEPQKGRHAEQALRAVRLAAPFDLPEEFYEGWKVVTSRFDRRLSE